MTSPSQDTTSVAVLVFDMARTGEPDGERIVSGFADVGSARAYAQARVRASIEELRQPGMAASELRTLWHMYGEDCTVLGGGFRGYDMLDRYIAEPATPGECDWPSLGPRS